VFEKDLARVSAQIQSALEEMEVEGAFEVEWSPLPFSGEWGFGTAVSFQIAAAEARAGRNVRVPERADEIAKHLLSVVQRPPGFSKVEAVRGYLNLSIEPQQYALRVIDTAIEAGDSFGAGETKSDRVMVEYAQPNTLHSFHIGHVRTTVLGESLSRIVELSGFDTIRASYPGDIGYGVISCMWAYQKFHPGEEPEGIHARGQWLAGVYAEATGLLSASDDESPEQAKQRAAYEAEVREMYRKWDEGDPEVRELWERTRRWSLDEFEAILALLGIEMDVFFFESEVDDLAKEIVNELIERGIAEDQRPQGGPVIVKIDEKLGLEHEKYRTAVILRSDGTTLYMTKDLALAKVKFERYEVDRSVYVVDVRQSLHFQQVFKILELWGFPQAEKCYHLDYGFVTLPEGAMSSRLGNIVFFMDVVEESKARVRAIISEKNPDLSETEREMVAKQVGLGALAYAMLSIDNKKDIVFDWDRALDFDGQAAPYIQYAHVRANSILKRAGELPPSAAPEYELSAAEITLVDRISRFPEEVQRAAEEYKPLVIANYAFDLAKDFSEFYRSCPVLGAEPQVRDVRLRITAAARQALANSLRLLVIEAPDVM
jgi:arginyl-tRNA synthetase